MRAPAVSAATGAIAERATAVLMDTYQRQPVALRSGHGVWVTADDGREYLDLVAGIAVNILGHDHPALREAIAAQASTLVHTSNLYYTEPQLELAELLIASARGLESSAASPAAYRRYLDALVRVMVAGLSSTHPSHTVSRPQV